MSIDGGMARPEGADDLGVSSSMPAVVHAFDLGMVLDEATLAKVRKVVTDGTPANTRRAYAADLRFFVGWRAASGFDEVWPVPPEVMVRFVVEQVEGMPPAVDEILVTQGFKRTTGIQSWSSVERRVAAIATAHRTRGIASPTAHPIVTEIVGRARRASVARGWAPKRKAAADRQILERLLDTCEDGLVGIRDRAILLFGFSTGGRRRSEISEATFERLQRVGQQYVYRMGRTKSEQQGSERPVPLTGRTAKAMARWIAESRIQDGALFRAVWDNGTVMPGPIDSRTVARMIKRRADLAGLDADEFGGHSLRAGFMTEAGARGISMVEAMSLSGAKDVNTAAIYYRAGEVLSVEAGRMMEGEASPRDGESAEDDLGGIVEAAVELAAAEVGAIVDPSPYVGNSGDNASSWDMPDAVSPARQPPDIEDTADDQAEFVEKEGVASVSEIEATNGSEPALRVVEEAVTPNRQAPPPELLAFRPSFLSD
jgi:integrase